MEKDWHNLDLRNSTIFDLTDDIEELREFCNPYIDEDNFQECKETEKTINWYAEYLIMKDYADYINDLELSKALNNAFDKELKEREKYIIDNRLVFA